MFQTLVSTSIYHCLIDSLLIPRFPTTAAKDTRAASHSLRDADPEHLAAFQAALKESTETYFDHVGTDQLKLQILGTHPDFRRRGLATSLCTWGTDLAARDGLAVVTLLASAQGYPLYVHLGFRSLGTQAIQAPGEEEAPPRSEWPTMCRGRRSELSCEGG